MGVGERKRCVAFSAVALLIFLTWQDFLRCFSNWTFRAEGQTSVALTGEEWEQERQIYLVSVLWQEKQGPLGQEVCIIKLFWPRSAPSSL